jgi:peptidyl-prolyl cis-trans isomerase D
MLSFVRRLVNSRLGLVITFAVLIVLALAFAAGDVTGMGSNTRGGMTGTTVATVGNRSISAADLRADAQRAMDGYRRQYPSLAMPEFINKGGLDFALDGRINSLAIDAFAASQKMRIGKSLIDNQIATAPPLLGLDGKFDKVRYQQFLQQQGISDDEMHKQLGRSLAEAQLVAPLLPTATGKIRASTEMATPYASMLLEKRSGTIAFVPTQAVTLTTPVTDAEAQNYYKANVARYSVPERRSVRYAVVTVADLKARSAPSDAEVAKAYQDQSARFQATEDRTLHQVVLLDQKSAGDLVAKVRGGTAIADAAKAAGLEAAAITDVTKTAYTAQSSADLANQVFSAASGATIGPVKTSLGWTVVHVDSVKAVSAKSLDQAKPDLVKELTDKKVAVVAASLRAQVDDDIANNKTIDEIARDLKLTLQTAPPLTAQGIDTDAKTPTKPDPAMGPYYQLAFSSEPEDDAQLIPVNKEGDFALAKLGRIVPAAPRPYATVADQVKKDLTIERQLGQSRTIARAITDKVNKGMSLAQAISQAGIKLPGTKPIPETARAALFARDPSKPVPAPLVLLFNTPLHAAKVLAAPYKGGWFVLVVDKVDRGDARGNKDIVEKMRSDLGSTFGDEYRQQYVRAMRNDVGTKKNVSAIADVRAELLGQGAPGGQ